MVIFEEIPAQEIRPLIEQVYEGDRDMQEQFHIVKGSLQEQVEYTYKQTVDEAEGVDMKFYRVIHNEEPIGYTSLGFGEVGLLYTFGIDKKHRTTEVKKLWLEAVEREFEGLFYVVTIREINTRALRFFQKNGFLQRYESEGKYYILWRQQ